MMKQFEMERKRKGKVSSWNGCVSSIVAFDEEKEGEKVEMPQIRMERPGPRPDRPLSYNNKERICGPARSGSGGGEKIFVQHDRARFKCSSSSLV